MKKFSISAFFLGIGIGLVFSYFFAVKDRPKLDPNILIKQIPKEIVAERAKEMGFVDPFDGDYKDLFNDSGHDATKN